MTKKLIDTKNIKKFLKKITNEYPNKVDKVVRRYNNNLAFETKKNIPKSLNQKMKIKSKKGENFLNRAVYVEKAKRDEGAKIGTLKYRQGKRTEYSKYILQKLFFGEKIRQFNSSGFFRASVFLGQKKLTKTMFRNKKMATLIKKKTKMSEKQRFLISLRIAKKNKQKFLRTDKSILKIKNKKLELVTSVFKEKTISTKKIDWLTPAVNQSLQRKDKIFIKAMNFELKR